MVNPARILLLVLCLFPALGAKAQASFDKQDMHARVISFVREWMRTLPHQDSFFFSTAIEMDSIKSDPIFWQPPYETSYGYWNRKQREVPPNDTLFNDEDIAYMRSQLEEYRNYAWNPEEFPNQKFMRSERIDSLFRKAAGSGWEWIHSQHYYGYRTMAVPLFSHKGDKVLFYAAYGCGGLCGAGQLRVYQLKKGKWQIIDHRLGWGS